MNSLVGSCQFPSFYFHFSTPFYKAHPVKLAIVPFLSFLILAPPYLIPPFFWVAQILSLFTTMHGTWSSKADPSPESFLGIQEPATGEHIFCHGELLTLS